MNKFKKQWNLSRSDYYYDSSKSVYRYVRWYRSTSSYLYGSLSGSENLDMYMAANRYSSRSGNKSWYTYLSGYTHFFGIFISMSGSLSLSWTESGLGLN